MSRKNQKDNYWLEIFDRYRASGKSQHQFCMDNNHPYPQFKYYWEKLVQKPKRAEPKFDENFAPVTIGPPNQETANSALSRPTKAMIELPNEVGYTLTIGSGLDDLGSLLKQLVTLLQPATSFFNRA